MKVRENKSANGHHFEDIKGEMEFYIDGVLKSTKKYTRKWNRNKEIAFWKENFEYQGKETYIIIKPKIED